MGRGLVGSGGSWRSPEGLAAAPGTREAGEEAAGAGGVGGGVDEEERGAELFYRIEGSLCCGAFNFDGVNMTMR